MLIKTMIVGASRIVHDGESFPVVKGIANVSEDAYKHLINFKGDYAAVTEEVEQEVLDQLLPKEEKPKRNRSGRNQGNKDSDGDGDGDNGGQDDGNKDADQIGDKDTEQ